TQPLIILNSFLLLMEELYSRTVFKDSVVFKGKGDAKLTEETLNQFKEQFNNTFKAHEAYAIAHPEVY
ncbi:root allergen protein-like protein, partial [Tanacetum coccineum]